MSFNVGVGCLRMIIRHAKRLGYRISSIGCDREKGRGARVQSYPFLATYALCIRACRIDRIGKCGDRFSAADVEFHGVCDALCCDRRCTARVLEVNRVGELT